MKAAICAIALFLAPSLASAAAGERYFVSVKGVEAVPTAPANLSLKAKAKLLELFGARKEFIPALEGAPDPAADPAAYREWLKKNKIRAFAVTINVSQWDRKLEPNPKAGKGGQLLTVHLEIELVGTAIPDDLLALGGEGGSTVLAEVGKNLRPREEEQTIDDALNEALTHAVDDAVAKLKGQKQTKPPARKK